MSTPPIIVKRVKKVVGGHHGGSWKIAYADFLAGMMTFFLLLWLVTLMEPKTKAQVAAYFKKFNIFSKAGVSMLMEFYRTGKIQAPKVQTLTQELPPVKGEGEKFKKIIETRLKSLQEHVLVEITETSLKEKVVRIEIMELVNKPLFKAGSAELLPEGKEILKVLAETIKELPVFVSVEGHTDASPSRAGKVGNWELSTARAISAMLELEKNGVHPDKILEVVGYADKFPLTKENPYDPRNRRITLTIHYGPPEGFKAKAENATALIP
ncbi:MAG: chemotaxis protein [Caldimicrobium thiodismutans]|uniref:Chemotaxis protein n=1 Tax=Caldimicrobium thiodismutans TaxID=1653476 RepID=A0A2N7PKT6_9BACT|nr:MAG: chemotaxis protein [Caldimicrobium thiodismutans]